MLNFTWSTYYLHYLPHASKYAAFFKCKLNCIPGQHWIILFHCMKLEPTTLLCFPSPAQCLKTETSSTLNCARVSRRRSCCQFSRWATRSWALRGLVTMLLTLTTLFVFYDKSSYYNTTSSPLLETAPSARLLFCTCVCLQTQAICAVLLVLSGEPPAKVKCAEVKESRVDGELLNQGFFLLATHTAAQSTACFKLTITELPWYCPNEKKKF